MLSEFLYICVLGNISLEALSPKRLKKKYICSEHFGKKEYINPHAAKSRLMPNAVPTKYLNGMLNINHT